MKNIKIIVLEVVMWLYKKCVWSMYHCLTMYTNKIKNHCILFVSHFALKWFDFMLCEHV